MKVLHQILATFHAVCGSLSSFPAAFRIDVSYKFGNALSKTNFTDSPRDFVFTQTLDSQLEIPNQERLLPIGQHNKDIYQFVDKVKHALGLNNQVQKMENIKNEQNNGRKEDAHITHSPRRLIKQVALESPPNQADFDGAIQFYKTLKLDNQSTFPTKTKTIFVF